MKKLFIFLCLIAALQVSAQHLDNFEKNYNRDCAGKCADPWVGDAFYKIWGLCPSQSGGQNDYCNINLYNNGHWSDWNNLVRHVRNKFTGKRSSGNIYIFIKPQNVNLGLGRAGHIGWAFQLSDGTLYGGSTENEKGMSGESYWVDAGGDNDFWAQRFNSDREMFSKFESLKYTQYKNLNIANPNILAAKLRSEEVMMKGFQGISNNCLDHTFQILEAYGLHFTKMPSRQVFMFPNAWFNQFYPNHNKNGVYGKNFNQ